MISSDVEGKIPSKIKVSLWIDSHIVNFIDGLAKNHGISRSDFIRLILHETLVNLGIFSREREFRSLTEKVVKS